MEKFAGPLWTICAAPAPHKHNNVNFSMKKQNYEHNEEFLDGPLRSGFVKRMKTLEKEGKFKELTLTQLRNL
jgi:hypothetical protein